MTRVPSSEIASDTDHVACKPEGAHERGKGSSRVGATALAHVRHLCEPLQLVVHDCRDHLVDGTQREETKRIRVRADQPQALAGTHAR